MPGEAHTTGATENAVDGSNQTAEDEITSPAKPNAPQTEQDFSDALNNLDLDGWEDAQLSDEELGI